MLLNKIFVKSLHPSITDVLPNGAQTEIAEEMNKSPLTVSKVLVGAWNNDPLVRKALIKIKEHHELLELFLAQIPESVFEDFKPHPT